MALTVRWPVDLHEVLLTFAFKTSNSIREHSDMAYFTAL